MATISLPNRLFAGVLTTVEGQIFTVQAGETSVVTSLTLTNLTDVGQTASVKMAGVHFIKNIDLAPRQITVFDFKQVLNAGESIQASAAASDAVSMFASGVQITQV
jgi:hypothetical protein